MSFFSHINDIEISCNLFNDDFSKDQRENKIDASIGLIYDESGKVESLKIVEETEKDLLALNLDKEYSTLQGLPVMVNAVTQLIFNNDLENIVGAQSITGGGSLRLGADILKTYVNSTIYFSDLTFGCYHDLFGAFNIKYYPYYDSEAQNLAFDSLVSFLKEIPEKSIINIQVGCHNPTNLNFSREQYDILAEIFYDRNLLAFFDMAYLGLSTGNIEDDFYSLRLFKQKGIEFFLAVSTGKAFLNCSNDIGIFIAHIVDSEAANRVKSLISVLNRSVFSFPSLQGARIIQYILTNEQKTKEWKIQLGNVFSRINSIRLELNKRLAEKLTTNSRLLSLISKQQGIYLFLSLNLTQINKLKHDYAIYLADHGRVNLTSINPKNIDYFIEKLTQVLLE